MFVVGRFGVVVGILAYVMGSTSAQDKPFVLSLGVFYVYTYELAKEQYIIMLFVVVHIKQSTANQTIHFELCTAFISRALALISNCKCIA
jgi:hypothetical protein